MTLFFVSFSAAAETTADTGLPSLPDAFRQMLGSLPDAVGESLPPALFGQDDADVYAGVADLGSADTFLSALGNALSGESAGIVRLFLRLCGVLLLRCLWENLQTVFTASGLSAGMRQLCRAVLCGVLLQAGAEAVTLAETCFSALQTLLAAFIPLFGALFALGGNVSAAVVSQAGATVSLSLISYIGGQTVIPFCSLCLAFTLPGMFDGAAASRMRVVTGKLRKWFLTGLSVVMLFLGTAMTAQTLLSSKEDSLGFKTARFVLADSVPFVGSGLSDLLRTAAAEVGWLRSLGGAAGLWLLLYTLLPGIVALFLRRLVWSLGADAAAFLDCPDEGRLMGEIGDMMGFLLAVLLLSALTFFFALLLLMHCTAAWG